MNCNPTPEVTCGTVTPDTCVAITMSDPTNGQTPINWACFLGENYKKECFRQSEFNFYIGNKLCALSTSVTVIQNQLGFTGNLALSGCTTFTPANTTVAAEFQALYTQLCQFQLDLDQPVAGLNLKCLADPCGNPIGTLGQLLQALINCCCDGKPSGNP